MTWDVADDADRYDEDRRDRANEDAREERWNAFVRWCKCDRLKSDAEWGTLLGHIARNMGDLSDWHYQEINDEIMEFKQAEGWDGVLNALARAYREQQAQ